MKILRNLSLMVVKKNSAMFENNWMEGEVYLLTSSIICWKWSGDSALWLRVISTREKWCRPTRCMAFILSSILCLIFNN